MIWLSSIILHLGMTLIGSDAKQFYNYKIRNCFLTIGNKQTYILYIMWILLTSVSLILTIIYVKRIYKDVSKRKFKDKSNFFITSPRFYERKLVNQLGSGKNFKIKYIINHIMIILLSWYFNILLIYFEFSNLIDYRTKLKNNKSQENLRSPQNRMEFNKRIINDCFYLSNSTSQLPNQQITNNCPMSYLRSSFDLGELDSSMYKTRKVKTRRFDFVKLILQRIKIQFLVIKLFIICWIPLFFTVLIDTKFKVSPTIYRYLILIAFSNSSLTPYCYLTILIPKINKYCLPCFRVDGKQSKKKTEFYNEMERYYEKLGDRMHNLSGKSSLSSLNVKQTNGRIDIKYETDILWLDQNTLAESNELNQNLPQNRNQGQKNNILKLKK